MYSCGNLTHTSGQLIDTSTTVLNIRDLQTYFSQTFNKSVLLPVECLKLRGSKQLRP